MTKLSKRLGLRKGAVVLLVVSLVICLLSSFFANLIQTDGFSVDIIELNQNFTVSDPNVTPATVKLDALIYKPSTATKENPAPLILTVHGTINNKEMQDLNAIELSRRGFVVIAFDLVAHGNSQVTSVRGDGVIQLIEYAATLDYVDGSRVGVSGHSRGGGVAQAAADYYNLKGIEAYQAVLDEAGVTEADASEEVLAEAMAAKIAANRVQGVLTVSCTPYTMIPGQKALTTDYYGPTTSVGVIAGQYDEFFFKDAGKYTGYNAAFPTTDKDRTNEALYEWLPKDYVSSPGAARFIKGLYTDFETYERHTVPLEGEEGYDASLPVAATNNVIEIPVEAVKPEVYYTASGELDNVTPGNKIDEPFRVIYTPAEIHPWAHFSATSCAHQVDFFYSVFGVPTGAEYIESGSQVWFIKEVLNLIGFVGIVMFIIAFAEIILRIPYFGKMRRLSGAYVDGSLPDESGITPYTLGLNDGLPELKGWKRHLVFWIMGIGISLIAGFSIRSFTSTTWNLGTTLLPTSTWFNQNYINQVVVWAILVSIITIIILGIYALIMRKSGDRPFARLKTGGNGNFIRALVGSFLVVAVAYCIELFSNKVFKTDYRFWTLAFRVFEPIKFWTILRYSALFAVFYVTNTLVNVNNRFKNVPEWATTALTALFNIFGIGLVFLIQYVVYFSTGAAWQWDAALIYVILFPIIPMLIAAAYISRKVYLRTGSVWYAGFINTFFMTIVVCANTSASASFPYIFF